MDKIEEAMRSFVPKVAELKAERPLTERAETLPFDDSAQLETIIPLIKALQAELDGVVRAQIVLSELVLERAASSNRVNTLEVYMEMERVEIRQKISDCVERMEAGNETAMAFAAQVRRWMVLLDSMHEAKQNGEY